ncbi:MAG: hypothetical protein HYY06_01785 [Deltaproteobacteria bacterium]|nr:hypothetical protein [Deltaproteobacteria bacterium]
MLPCCGRHSSLVAFLLVACGGRGAGPDGGARLVPEAEIAELKRSLMATMAENRTRVCKRPLLRGQALEGSADEDIRALIEPTGDLAACLEATRADGVREALAFPAAEGAEEPPIRTARPLGDPASLTPAIQEVDARCGMLPEAIGRAVGHEDACSPYLTGRRPEPSLLPYLGVCRAVAARARHLGQEGQLAPALRLLFDALRLGQDLSRGGPGLLIPMMSAAGGELLLPQAEVLLQSGALSAEDASSLASELDTLIANEVHWSEFLRGEYADMALYMVLPQLEPAGWVPPGGWPDGMGSPTGQDASGALRTKSMGLPPRDEEALAWVALDETTRGKRAACPASATLQTCIAALARLTTETVARGTKLGLPPLSRGPTKATRRQILDILEGIAAPADAKYARRYARRLARLAAMRIHLEARRAATCPAEGDFGRTPLQELLSPAALGGTLGVVRADGGVDVAPPDWLAGTANRREPIWRIRCPPR